MKERIIALYTAGRLSATGLANAVGKGWLTQEEVDALIAEQETEVQS